MRKHSVWLMAGLIWCVMAQADKMESMVTKKSPHTVAVTLDRMESVLKEKGIGIVARVNHAAAAHKVGIEMRDTELLIFGNPKLGSPLMVNQQTTAIDLPMKVIAWKDDKGQVWIGYNKPENLVSMHGLTGQDEIIKKMAGALNDFTNVAIAAK